MPLAAMYLRRVEDLSVWPYLGGADASFSRCCAAFVLAVVVPPAPAAHVLAVVAQRDATLSHQEKSTRRMSKGAESLNVASVART